MPDEHQEPRVPMGHNEVAAFLGLPLLPEIPTRFTCLKCGHTWSGTVARGDNLYYSCKECIESGRGVVTLTATDIEKRCRGRLER